MKYRAVVAAMMAGVLGMAAGGAVLASGYPSKPVRVIVPYVAGGAADITARVIAQKLSVSMGATFVVENKPGANGMIGTDFVAKAAPDGYTLLLDASGPLVVNPSLYKKTPYEKGAIRLQVELGHGLNGRPVNDPGLLWSSGALAGAGIGPFTPDELTRLTAGRQVGFGLQQTPDALTFGSRTDSQDEGDALKLIVGAITQMRYAETPLNRMKDGFKASYQAYFAAPSTVLRAFGAPYFHGGDKRFEALPSPDAVAGLTLDQFRDFWQTQLGQGPIKVIAVGDFDPDSLVADVAKTLGALPPRPDVKPTPAELEILYQDRKSCETREGGAPCKRSRSKRPRG